MRLIRSHLLMLSALFVMLMPLFAHAQAIGEVIFAVGDATAEGASQALVKGASIEVGQTLRTGANGHIHIRFVDQAFVSVRPNSLLRVEQYVYDPEHPENNRVKFTLDHGTSRLITGKAGQAAKQNFRLNTPVAALGVRGTDFVVQAADDVTRVAVQQGAVVLSPFGNDCQLNALGPCGGASARELAGSLTGNYLELKGQSIPNLVVPENGKANRLFAPSRPEEPGVKGKPSASTDTPTQTAAQGLPEGLSGTSGILWGRWGGATGVGLNAPVGYELIGHNDALVLFRALDKLNLPQSGYINFQLTESQAFGRVGQGGYNAAAISNASLAVNFNSMKYNTKFDWQFGGLTQAFHSKGGISDNGRFSADRAASNMSVSGALSGNGGEAAYIFSKHLDNGVSAYGVLHWQGEVIPANVSFRPQ